MIVWSTCPTADPGKELAAAGLATSTPTAASTASDLLMLAQGFGSRPGHPQYTAGRDLNKDNQIDVSDVLILAGDWGP